MSAACSFSCGRFIGNSPCGRQIIISTISAPSSNMLYSFRSRISSRDTTSRIAARMTANCEPMPQYDDRQYEGRLDKGEGFRADEPRRAANSVPANPAKAALMVKQSA